MGLDSSRSSRNWGCAGSCDTHIIGDVYFVSLMSIDQCKSYERTGLAWVRLGMWKLRVERKKCRESKVAPM